MGVLEDFSILMKTLSHYCKSGGGHFKPSRCVGGGEPTEREKGGPSLIIYQEPPPTYSVTPSVSPLAPPFDG